MTRDLKNLMDRATERPEPFTPDLDRLLVAGRRRARAHRAVVSAAAVSVAAVVAVAAVLVGGLRDDRSAPDPATSPTPSRPAYTDLCAKSDDYFRTVNNDAWRRQVVANWTTKVVEVADADGTMTVRRSPDGTTYAYCVAGVLISGQPLNGFGATLLNVGIVTRENQIQRYWSGGCGNDPATDRDYGSTACRGVRYSYAGRVPDGVTRITFRGLGQQADATIKDGFWAYRIYTDRITNSSSDPVWIFMYDETGREVFKRQYS